MSDQKQTFHLIEEFLPGFEPIIPVDEKSSKAKVNFILSVLNSTVMLESKSTGEYLTAHTLTNTTYRQQLEDYMMMEIVKYLKDE